MQQSRHAHHDREWEEEVGTRNLGADKAHGPKAGVLDIFAQGHGQDEAQWQEKREDHKLAQVVLDQGTAVHGQQVQIRDQEGGQTEHGQDKVHECGTYVGVFFYIYFKSWYCMHHKMRVPYLFFQL